jgi:hypothetical protein
LPPNTIEVFDEDLRAAAERMYPGLSGGYEAIIKMVLESKNVSALDCVSVDVFEKLLECIPGMKIGRVHNKEVVWRQYQTE